MKHYPSIPVATGQAFRELEAYVFDKLDGSLARAEWTPKAGLHKFGTRTRLVDLSDPDFGQIPDLFVKTFDATLARVARKERYQHLVLFAEFWGDQSFAGLHVPDDAKRLTLFDVAANKRGFLPPKEFRHVFADEVPTPRFLGKVTWTRGYCARVRAGEVEGVTNEGVVAKAQIGRELVMAKAKTQVWLDAVAARYGEARAVEEGA